MSFRPKRPPARTTYVHIRLTDQEKVFLKSWAKRMNMTVTDFLVYCVNEVVKDAKT